MTKPYPKDGHIGLEQKRVSMIEEAFDAGKQSNFCMAREARRGIRMDHHNEQDIHKSRRQTESVERILFEPTDCLWEKK